MGQGEQGDGEMRDLWDGKGYEPDGEMGEAYALRPYQADAIEAIVAALREHDSTLCVKATGLGKTITAAHIAKRMDGGVLFLAHRDELIQQAARKLEDICQERVEIEKADQWADERAQYRLVVASVQTLNSGRDKKRMERFFAGRFKLVIADEAHHYVAQSFRRVIDHFRAGGAKIMGLTATPNRADEAALGQIFESVAYQYELQDAIPDGWLVPLRVVTHHLESLDLSHVSTTAGDFNQAELSEEMRKQTAGIVPEVLKVADGRKTLVFASSVPNAEALAALFNGHQPGSAMVIHGGTDPILRRSIVRDFREGAFQILTNCAVATEGFDVPDIQVVVVARPTKSLPLYQQIIGRGTRPLPGVVDGLDTAEDRRRAIETSAKPFLTVLDFKGNAGRHKLCRAVDVLGGRYDDDVIEEAQKAVERMGAQGIPADVAAELERAKERREAARRRLERRRSAIRVRAKWAAREVNPFDVLDITPHRSRGWDKSDPITEPQRCLLLRFGLTPELVKDMTKRQASQVIDELIRRKKAGLPGFRESWEAAKRGEVIDVPKPPPLRPQEERSWDEITLKQEAFLKRYGLDVEGASKKEASWLIARIRQNGFKCPPELRKLHFPRPGTHNGVAASQQA